MNNKFKKIYLTNMSAVLKNKGTKLADLQTLRGFCTCLRMDWVATC